MADDLRVHTLDVAHLAFGVIVQVRAANAHRLNTHQQFARARPWRITFAQRKTARREQFGNTHHRGLIS